MKLCMGIDSSTQGIKAVIIDPQNAEIVATESINFAAELGAKYNSPEAVLPNDDPLVKHSNPLMWVEGLELLFEKLQKNNVPLCEIRRIAGCGQQHGSVYVNEKFSSIISASHHTKPLYENLEQALTRKTSPIWMDSSTSKQCQKLEKLIGKEQIRRITGSPPIERFTGPQIMKFIEENPLAYQQTAQIHLVSSFICSILAGKSAPIDYGDGAGMNLMNLDTLNWDDTICNTISPELKTKLPPLKKAGTIVGKINPYFLKFGFNKNCEISVWTGDNPASLVGTGAAIGNIAVISLGTSDTFFAAMKTPHTDPDGCGHVFGNPAGGFMSLICFKNGSLARERLKNNLNVDWDYFGIDAFKNTIPGGGTDNLMTPHFIPEITPLKLNPKVLYSGSEEFVSGKASKDLQIRALVESQVISMKIHSAWIGENFKTIRITGGGSKSPGICQTVADVFQTRVETISIPDSAALGAAIIAATADNSFTFEDLSAKFAKPSKYIEPNPTHKETYLRMIEKYKKLEAYS